jgi:hypothetical protein
MININKETLSFASLIKSNMINNFYYLEFI